MAVLPPASASRLAGSAQELPLHLPVPGARVFPLNVPVLETTRLLVGGSCQETFAVPAEITAKYGTCVQGAICSCPHTGTHPRG